MPPVSAAAAALARKRACSACCRLHVQSPRVFYVLLFFFNLRKKKRLFELIHVGDRLQYNDGSAAPHVYVDGSVTRDPFSKSYYTRQAANHNTS